VYAAPAAALYASGQLVEAAGVCKSAAEKARDMGIDDRRFQDCLIFSHAPCTTQASAHLAHSQRTVSAQGECEDLWG